jgi:hypothetical protein
MIRLLKVEYQLNVKIYFQSSTYAANLFSFSEIKCTIVKNACEHYLTEEVGY